MRAVRDTGAPPTQSEETAGSRRWRPAIRGRLNATTLVLIGTLVVALALRLWGIRHGLPFVYNADEDRHFVPVAVAALGGDFHPHSFINPPAFGYLVAALAVVWNGGTDEAVRAWRADPAELYLIGRVAAAVLGTVGVWLLYLAGTRLFGRVAGLAAAVAMAVAFLPVLYSHYALNDVPAMTALTLSLLGTAGVLRDGRRLDYVLAGVGAGLAAGLKYPSGVVLLALLVACAVQALDRDTRRIALGGAALGGACALIAFLLIHPYALLAFSEVRGDLEYISNYNSRHFFGIPHDDGYTYYPWSLTWTLGWAPALAALVGGVVLGLRDPRTAAALILPGIVFFVVVGSYPPFVRYFLPVFPIVCLLAGYAVDRLVAFVTRARPGLRAVAFGLALAALAAQGLVYAVHNDLVLSRTETRALARQWMLDEIPAGARVALEPLPRRWVPEERWEVLSAAAAYRDLTGVDAGPARVLRSSYLRFLRPGLIDYYRAEGVCWVMTTTATTGRLFAEPEAAPEAVAYYERLAREAEVVFEASPYDPGEGPIAFNYDLIHSYYPLAYDRPGPEVGVYRLRGGRCP